MMAMSTRVLCAASALLLAASGCARIISEEDVFLPEMAEGSLFSYDRTRGDTHTILFAKNKANPEIWRAFDAQFSNGAFASPIGDINWRLARNEVLAKARTPPLIVKCGGNSFDVPNHGDLSIWTSIAHGDVLVWDYPGYGDSGGAPTVAHFRQASAALLGQIDSFRRAPAQPVVFWGYSLGGFVCAELAASFSEKSAVVFVASAPSAQSAAAYFTPWYAKPFVRVRLSPEIQAFDNVATLAARRLKVLTLGAGEDRILPVQLSRALRDQLDETGHDVAYHEFKRADHFNVGMQREFRDVAAAFFATIE